MLKNAPNQANNFTNFSEMLLTKNQLFGSSARSDLQALSHLYFSINVRDVDQISNLGSYWKLYNLFFFKQRVSFHFSYTTGLTIRSMYVHEIPSTFIQLLSFQNESTKSAINLFVTSKTKPPIHHFTDLKCCKRPESLLRPF